MSRGGTHLRLFLITLRRSENEFPTNPAWKKLSLEESARADESDDSVSSEVFSLLLGLAAPGDCF